MKIIYSMLLLLIITNTSYGYNDWMPYNTYPSPPQVYVSSIPTVTYTTNETFVARPAIMTYKWVPYYSTKTIVIERQGLLCKYRTVMSQPTIEWVYQPVWE